MTKNIDFTQWESDENLQALWLSGLDQRGMRVVSSHIIGAAKKKAHKPNGFVLYFFCSTATEARGSIATVFAHTLLHQIICSSSDNKAKAIVVAFLKSLLEAHSQRQRLSRFKKSDSLSKSIEILLNVPDNELHRALVEASRTAGIQELWIIIDGIDIITPEDNVFVQNVYCIVKHMMDSIPKLKALLTSSQNSNIQNILGRLPCIEQDRERQGLIINRSPA